MKDRVPYAEAATYTFDTGQKYSEALALIQDRYVYYRNDKNLQICIQAFGLTKHQLYGKASSVERRDI